MAIPAGRISFKFQDPREPPNKVAERFYGRVAFPDVRKEDQFAKLYNRAMEMNEANTINDIHDKQQYANIQLRIKQALAQKERFINEIQYAPNEDQVDFYKKQISILDNLINELRLDLERAGLTREYMDNVAKMNAKEIGDTRKLELTREILKVPPAVAPEFLQKLRGKIKMPEVGRELQEYRLEKEFKEMDDLRTLKRDEAQKSIAGAMRQRLAKKQAEIEEQNRFVKQFQKFRETEKKQKVAKKHVKPEEEVIEDQWIRGEEEQFKHQFKAPKVGRSRMKKKSGKKSSKK